MNVKEGFPGMHKNLLQIQMIMQDAAIEIVAADALGATLQRSAFAGGHFVVLALLQPGFGPRQGRKGSAHDSAFVIRFAE